MATCRSPLWYTVAISNDNDDANMSFSETTILLSPLWRFVVQPSQKISARLSPTSQPLERWWNILISFSFNSKERDSQRLFSLSWLLQFLASQDALEVMLVSQWVSQWHCWTELTDVTLVSEDTYWRLYWEALIINDTYGGDVREIVVGKVMKWPLRRADGEKTCSVQCVCCVMLSCR